MLPRTRPKSGIIGDDACTSGTSTTLLLKKDVSQNESLKIPQTKKKIIKRVLESNVSSPPKKKKSPPLVTNKLKQFGNAKAWADLISHLTGDDKHKPILIHGPVGCGKTLGVQECLKICNINCTLLDGSTPENPHELDSWISQVRDNSVLEGEGGVLFIDDIESFTEQCKDVILKHIKKTNKSKSPLVITCTNYYAYELKDFLFQLKNYTNIRLYAPNNDVVSNFLKSKGYSLNIVNSVVPTCKGDFRQSDIAIKMFYQTKGYFDKVGKSNSFSASTLDRESNIFEIANSLLTRKNDNWFEIFSSNGDTSHMSHIRLLHENLVSLLYEPTKINIRDPLESYGKIVDSFTYTTWNCLSELVHSSGLLCRNLLMCKTVTNKWNLTSDKSRIIYKTKKECFRSLRDSYVNRASLNEKRNSLRSFYEMVYDEESVPSTEKMSSSELDQAFYKINPCRLISNSIEYWDVPSSLGGLKIL
tara:strand:+ start:3305 stop:4726 length:1422 start_codon:yes stop_codon:yes gene_type:complete